MNMNRILHIAAAVILLLGSTACQKHTIISDEQLADIFHDVFLANAYTSGDINRIDLDSMNIYEPIIHARGYTIEDIQYTIGNFSKRKSARLGDVVEVAIARLEKEGKYYEKEVAILDTINNVAQRTFTRTVKADSLIRVGRLKDSTRLKMQFDLRPGEYTLDLDYLVDSLDENLKGLRAEMWVEKSDKGRAFAYNIPLQRYTKEHFHRRFTTDTTHLRLHINFLKFNTKAKRPSIRVTDFKLAYQPLTDDAVDSLFAKQLNFRIFTDEFFRAFAPKPAPAEKADSLASAVEE